MNSLIDRIAENLNLDRQYVASITRRSECYYKDYTIPKMNGTRRKIAQASPELKSLQYWVRENILMRLPVSNSAFAYKRGDSIKRHATYHKDAHFVFHTDIKDFFPSICTNTLTVILESNNSVIKNAGYWYEDTCEIIAHICFRNNHLCIGTVSSPAISNIVMYDFDEYFRSYCHDQGYLYSRYADDIYISSHTYIPRTIKNMLSDQLLKKGFLINKIGRASCRG
ncbi:MAG: reverse transcriptase domain-containing protein, partial [Clostridia bacterium]|nr:reverse transcriptase domain-containing protein [Clostridia bacterium]